MQGILLAARFFSKNMTWFIVAGLLVSLYYAFKPLWLRLFGQIPADFQYIIGGGDVTKSFVANVKNKVDQIRKGIKDDSVFGSDLRCNILQEVLTYNDNELILVHNTYKNKYGITLFSDLQNISGDGCANLFSVEYNVTLKEKLNKIGIV